MAARGLERELELKRHALKMCEEKLASSSYTQIANDVIALENSLITLEEVRTCYVRTCLFLLLFYNFFHLTY